MSVGSELDVDVQDMMNAVVLAWAPTDFTDEDEALDMRAALLAQLLRMGWLPPTYTAHVKAQVKQAWEAVEDDESFKALRSAAGVLDVELHDPHADTAPALGKVA